jgi:hypothetical protein
MSPQSRFLMDAIAMLLLAGLAMVFFPDWS